MNDRKSNLIKLAILMIVPQIGVTIGGILIYGTASAFFSSPGQYTTSPAAVYYGMSVVISLMFFLLRQGYAGYEFIAYGIASVIFSFALKKNAPLESNSLFAYLLPMLLFFTTIWLILKFVYLHPPLRQMRLLLFALMGAAAFSLAFWLQFVLIKQTIEPNFFQTRFISGIFFMVFLGFGFSMAELVIARMVIRAKAGDPRLSLDDGEEEPDTENEGD